MSRQVQACPECDETKIYHRRMRPREHPYLCAKCGHEFDEPIRRGERAPGGGIPEKTLAAKLAAADPDELGI